MNIFISYAQADQDWVFELVASLRATGLDPNAHADDPPPGDDWLVMLRQQIDAAELVVPVFTEHSFDSAVFLFELGAAKAARRSILPLLVTRKGAPPIIPSEITGHRYLRVKTPQEAAEQIARYAAEQLTLA